MASILMADVLEHQLLPVDAQDVVTRVRLVVAGQEAGIDPWGTHYCQMIQDLDSDPNTGEVPIGDVQYYPDPVTFVYEAPEHAIYGVERSFGLPSGVNPFLPPEHPDVPEPTWDPASINNPGLPSVVRDGDPLTYATIVDPNSPGNSLIQYAWDSRFVGWAAHVEGVAPAFAFNTNANTGAEVIWEEHRVVETNQTAVLTWAWYALPTGQGSWQYSVFPGDARGNVSNGADGRHWSKVIMQIPVMQPRDPVPQPNAKIYAFYPLILNEALLEEIARAQIRLPAQAPRRVTVRGALPPTDTSHTIVGWPGGDYTGVVARQTYREGVTVVDFEQAGAPPGVPQELLEAERVRTTRTQAAIANANYNLMMGSRR